MEKVLNEAERKDVEELKKAFDMNGLREVLTENLLLIRQAMKKASGGKFSDKTLGTLLSEEYSKLIEQVL